MHHSTVSFCVTFNSNFERKLLFFSQIKNDFTNAPQGVIFYIDIIGMENNEDNAW